MIFVTITSDGFSNSSSQRRANRFVHPFDVTQSKTKFKWFVIYSFWMCHRFFNFLRHDVHRSWLVVPSLGLCSGILEKKNGSKKRILGMYVGYPLSVCQLHPFSGAPREFFYAGTVAKLYVGFRPCQISPSSLPFFQFLSSYLIYIYISSRHEVLILYLKKGQEKDSWNAQGTLITWQVRTARRKCSRGGAPMCRQTCVCVCVTIRRSCQVYRYRIPKITRSPTQMNQQLYHNEKMQS